MTADHEATIRAAVEGLTAAILAAAKAEADPGAPERLLSIPEAADAMSLGRTALYRLLERGELRSVKAGRRRLIPSSAITEYIDAARD